MEDSNPSVTPVKYPFLFTKRNFVWNTKNFKTLENDRENVYGKIRLDKKRGGKLSKCYLHVGDENP